MDPLDPLRSHAAVNTWPTPMEYGDRCPLLAITPCYTVPQTTDPAVLYSDRSHSMNQSEVLKHVREHPNQEIPFRKVLRTALETSQVNVRDFLQCINDDGLEQDGLIIGLKGKEREIKQEGRLVSLMSWNVRQYFIITKHRLKEFIVPLLPA